MVDGTSGDYNIPNIFRRKYKSLFNSVVSSDEEIADLSQRIQSAVTDVLGIISPLLFSLKIDELFNY